MASSPPFESWLRPGPSGLHCVPGDFHIDPSGPVPRAVITHGHSDHARPGHDAVLATADTLAIMRLRLGTLGQTQALAYGVPLRVKDVTVTLVPAGHILGSAQVVIDYNGQRAVISGDYKRHADPTCEPFELVPCDLFVTEATFGLPVYRHEPDTAEVQKLLASLRDFPERTHQIGVYGLGKCQRLIKLIRKAGYDRPIWLHGALRSMTDYYVSRGIDLGEVPNVADAPGTLAAVEQGLRRGSTMLRYDTEDDFGLPETAFNVCTFWLIEALYLTGRSVDARALFEEMLAKRTGAGLLSEDIDPNTGELWGNYPQTYSLVGIINCAVLLSHPWNAIR